jgi:hypothetical protein
MIRKLLALTLLTAPLLPAQFITPEWRGSENSEHAEWDIFTSDSEPNRPDLVIDSPSEDATLRCNTPTAFVTSSGNIYDFQSAIALQIDDSADFPIKSIFLQVRGLGSTLDLSTVRLVPPDAVTLEDIITPSEQFLIESGDTDQGRGGNDLTYAFQWNLTAEPLQGTYSILFKAAESSLSLDQVSLDTSDQYRVVPEPGTSTEPIPIPAISISGDEITLSWPSGEDIALQSSQNLADPGSWQPVTEPITTSDGSAQVTLPMTASATFFRLQE